MYWPDWMCERAREQGLEGQRLRLLWGGHNQDTRFSRFKVGPGDRVVPVTSIDGVLYALACVEVATKTDADAWLPRHPEDAKTRLHGCGSELLVAREGAGVTLAFSRAFDAKALARWRYDGSSGPRPLKYVEGGRLKKTLSVQGVYRVTADTERLVDEVLATPVVRAPKTTATDLKAALKAKPDDEGAARVLADAWQDAGDVRGEVLALELGLAAELDPAAAARLDERHAALMRAKAGLKKLPGGFPLRSAQGGRDFIELSTGALALRAATPPALLEAFFELAHRLLEVEGFDAIEVLQRAMPEGVAERLGALKATRRAGPWNIYERKTPFTLDEARGVLARAPALRLHVTGPLRANDGGPRLPLLAASQWLGQPPHSTLDCSLADGTLRGTFRAPRGTPLADRRLAELDALLRALGGAPARRRLRRTSRGDELCPSP